MNSDFIILVRKVTNEPFPLSEGTVKELDLSKNKLLKQVEKTIRKNRKTGRVFLDQNYKEVFAEFEYTKTKVLRWLNKRREQGFDEYNNGFSNTKELLHIVGDTLQYLNDFARNYYPTVKEATPETKKATEQKHELSMKQIALIYYYNREQVTRENCKDKAEKQGHISGNKLYNFYCYYSSRSNRTNPEETAIKTRNKINLIESIIQHLSTEHKQEAIDELSTLKSKENKYI